MNDRHARYGAATGILFVIFVIVGFLVTAEAAGRRRVGVGSPRTTSSTSTTRCTSVQLIFGAAGLLLHLVHRHAAQRSWLGAEGGEGRLANTAFGGGLIAVGDADRRRRAGRGGGAAPGRQRRRS